MKFLRFSIASLVGTVAICAVGLACLMFASTPWAGMLLSVTLAALTLALLGVLYRRGERRASWAGFALCGWTYMTLSFGPWFTDYVRPRLVTTNLLEWAYPQLIPSDRRARPRNANQISTLAPVELEGDLTLQNLNQSRVDVWVRSEGQESPSLLVEGVRTIGGSVDGTAFGVNIRVDAEQFAKLEQAKARADSPSFNLRPHSPGLFARLSSSPPVATSQFDEVGHSLFGLLCAWIGSLVARYFFATRDREATAQADGT
jgi:hypothetical protein